MSKIYKKIYQKIQEGYNAINSWSKIQRLLFHTALALTFTSGLSYIFGLVRDKVLANTFGASSALDVYNAAFVIPDFLLAVLVTSALSAAFIPIFTAQDEKSREDAMLYTNHILTLLMSVLIGISLAIAIFLPQIAPFFVPGFDESAREQYVMLARLFLLSPLLFALSNTFGGILISTRVFFWYGIAPVFYNIGIIMGALVLVPHWGIYGLACGTLIGVAAHASIRAIFVFRYGFRFRPQIALTPQVRETLLLMTPKFFQIGMWQILLFWFIRLASSLPEGSITVYSFARNFQSAPVSLIGIAIALASFSRLSHLAARKEFGAFQKLVYQKAIFIFGITTLAAIALGIIAKPLVALLLGGGAFDERAVQLTASILMVYVLSIPLESTMHLLARSHYALKNTLRPALFHIGAIIVTIGLSIIFVKQIGIFAIPVSFTIGLLLDVVLLVVSQRQLLKKKINLPKTL